MVTSSFDALAAPAASRMLVFDAVGGNEGPLVAEALAHRGAAVVYMTSCETVMPYVSTIIEADIDDVWSVLHDFHRIDRWVGRIRSAELENDAGPDVVGSVRWLTMEPPARVVRGRLVHYDAPGHRYSYEFAGDQPYPVRAYRGTIHLLPVTQSGTTFAEWYGEFDCDAALADELTGQFTRICAAFPDELRLVTGVTA